ncbi:MAG: hypothetical protein ACOYL6_16215 [Bacteriovoracaceae bacterium]
MKTIFILPLMLFSMSAYSKLESSSAICLSLQTGKGFERLAYTLFSEKICGKYSKNLQIIYRHSEIKYPVSEFDRKRITDFLKSSQKVDVFFFGHTNNASFYFVNDFKDYLGEKVRLVYNSGCFDGDKWDAFRWQGYTKVYVGHPMDNYGTRYTPFFLKRWFKGLKIEHIVKLSNNRMNKEKYFEGGNDPYGYFYGDGSLSIND